jgi:hypothetical protein
MKRAQLELGHDNRIWNLENANNNAPDQRRTSPKRWRKARPIIEFPMPMFTEWVDPSMHWLYG